MKIRAVFAYYNPGFEDIEPSASYLIVESDNPMILKGSNVGAEFLEQNGVDIPKTPSYAEWVESGSPIYRGREDK